MDYFDFQLKSLILIIFFNFIFTLNAQTFPCNFNVYEVERDGRITMSEFSSYIKENGYAAGQSELAFSTLDSNGT